MVKFELIVTAPPRVEVPDTVSAASVDVPATNKTPWTDAVFVVKLELIFTAPARVEIPATVRTASEEVPATVSAVSVDVPATKRAP